MTSNQSYAQHIIYNCATKMPPLSVPTSSALPHHQRVSASNPGVARILGKLSRPALLSLALDWLEEDNQAFTAPYLAPDDEEQDATDLFPASSSLEELRDIYSDLQTRRGTRRDLVDRIIEGDWRSGLSLYQLAGADLGYLYSHPLSQKWTALRVVQLSDPSIPNSSAAELPSIPRFHPPTFLQNLQRSVLPDVKAHYQLDRSPDHPVMVLRIFMLDSPYNTSLSLSHPHALDAAKTVFVAFPDNSPHIFISLTTTLPSSKDADSGPSTADAKSLRRIVLDAIPKAFSRPRARYALQPTNFSARGLGAMCERRGGGRTNAAGAAWSTFAEGKKSRRDTPLNTSLPLLSRVEKLQDDEKENDLLQAETSRPGLGTKRKSTDESQAEVMQRKAIAKSRFGLSALPEDGKGIERLDIRIADPFPHTALERNDDGWAPDVRVTFHGSHVFAGLRRMVERGMVNGKEMPGWMTGEEGVSVGVVEEGRVMGFKGSGVS